MIDHNQKLRPLENLKVLELGHILAGAFSATILGYFGAQVIKVEPPKDGDPMQEIGEQLKMEHRYGGGA